MYTEPLIDPTKTTTNYMTSSLLDAGLSNGANVNEVKHDDERYEETGTDSKSSTDVSTPLKVNVDRERGYNNNNKNNNKTSNNKSYNSNNNSNSNAPDLANEAEQPSFTRRLSSQFSGGQFSGGHLDRQSSVNNMASTVTQYIPDAIANNIPGFNRGTRGAMHATYFCNICFTNYPMSEGFTLRNCKHQFCTECVKGFFTNKIENGRVLHLKCFYPMPPENQPCAAEISSEDIRQVVDEAAWLKMERYVANISNHLTRQCPYCDHTQVGKKENPVMNCEQCSEAYCLFHANAHPMSESCASYDQRMAKEDKLAEEAIGDAKPCPKCNFRIQKNGGCNHMKCVNCECSFCWLCMQEIENNELPNHYKDDGPCKGKQFEGMEGEAPPRWLIAVLVVCACIFFIPAAALGIVLGLLCFPLAFMCGCCTESSENISIVSVVQGCFLGWLIFLMFVAIFIPLVIFLIIFSILKTIYNVARIMLPCLPACPEFNPQQAQERLDAANAGLDATEIERRQQEQAWNAIMADNNQNRNANANNNDVEIRVG